MDAIHPDYVEMEGEDGEWIQVYWPVCTSIACKRRASPGGGELCPMHDGKWPERLVGAKLGPGVGLWPTGSVKRSTEGG